MSDNEYYPYPWQINYSQWQIRWLLKPENWSLIKINQWSFCIKDDVASRAGVSHHAAFEMIVLIKAEVEERLEATGKDGDMCVARFHNEYNDERIARMFNIPIERVSKRIRRAMIYMAGKRKPISYSEWIGNGWSEIPRRNGKRLNSQMREISYGKEKKTVCS